MVIMPRFIEARFFRTEHEGEYRFEALAWMPDRSLSRFDHPLVAGTVIKTWDRLYGNHWKAWSNEHGSAARPLSQSTTRRHAVEECVRAHLRRAE